MQSLGWLDMLTSTQASHHGHTDCKQLTAMEAFILKALQLNFKVSPSTATPTRNVIP